jgi:hypothetical protein
MGLMNFQDRGWVSVPVRVGKGVPNGHFVYFSQVQPCAQMILANGTRYYLDYGENALERAFLLSERKGNVITTKTRGEQSLWKPRNDVDMQRKLALQTLRVHASVVAWGAAQEAIREWMETWDYTSWFE